VIRTTDCVAKAAIWVLLCVALVPVFMLGPLLALIILTPLEWAAVVLLVVVPVVLFLVRQRPIRLVWLLSPALVIGVGALVLSGIPQSVRFTAAEPELTRYVQGLDAAPRLPHYDEPITVGGVPVYEVIREDDQVLLVTGFIGILGDDPAGLAYVLEGTPVGVGWEHIDGSWYRWIPTQYVDDEGR
jgi:hypothetical protein